MSGQIEIYQSPEGSQVEVQFEHETIWLTQLQMAQLFDKDVRTVNEHIKNIYKTGELDPDSTIRKFRIVRREGNRQVKRNLDHYNLDMIISVGYRVNSIRGTQFRIWATQRLEEYLLNGYAINKKRLAQKQQEVQYLKDGIHILSKAIEENAASSKDELMCLFKKGLQLLDDYDNHNFDQPLISEQEIYYPEKNEYLNFINRVYGKQSKIFAQPKDESFESSINQIRQSFNGKELYPSLEEKAAMLLYLIVKNHSFIDGNKRIAASCFIYFLKKNNLLKNQSGQVLIDNNTLALITLFIAVSDPNEKDTVLNFIITVINRNKRE